MSTRTVSLRLSRILGKRVVLNSEFSGYSAGSKAVIDQFVVTKEGAFFHLLFEDIPCSLEGIEIKDLGRICEFVGKRRSGLSLRHFIAHGLPPRRESFDLDVSE